jgi:hypothetical protein
MRPEPSTSLSLSRPLLAATVALGLTAVAVPALAQDAPALRYLDWNGRPAPVAMARATETPRGTVPALRPVSPVIPHAGSQSMATVPQLRPATPLLPGRSVDADGRPGLTPADAFFAPSPVQSRPQPAPAPARTVAGPVEAPTPVRPMPEPPPAPVQPAPQPAPAPAPVAYSAPAPAPARPAEWADDPNAPRSDALIWSVGQPQPQPALPQATQQPPASQPQAAPTQPRPQPGARSERAPQGARYYSVHRQNGRQPDRAVLPEQVYLDALPVQMDQTPTSPNMAAPPGPPQLVRNPDGTVRRTTGESTSSAASRQ